LFDERRTLLLAAAVAPLAAFGAPRWSSFDQDKAGLSGRGIKAVRWANPHAEVVLVVDGAMKLPADLGRRSLPAQSQNVDGAAILARTRLPSRRPANGRGVCAAHPACRPGACASRRPATASR